MPNWCEGTLKVRGTLDNVRRFMEKGINWAPSELVVKDYDDELEFSVRDTCWRWIKGTKRHFVVVDEDMYFIEGHTLFLHLNAAWCVSAEDLQTVCQTYGIDMKVEAYERGMEFGQIVEIVSGEIIRDEDIDYPDYEWDCPCPTLGG